MNIEMFVAQMNGDHKESIIQKHLTRKYVPLEEKIATAKKIIETSCYKNIVDANGNTGQMFWVDSVTQHFLTIRALITMYTDLTFSDDPLKDYNMLAENGYDKMLLGAIPIDDAQEFTNIIDMIYDDEYENVNTVQGRLKNFISGFDNIFQAAVEKMVLDQINGGEEDGAEDGHREN